MLVLRHAPASPFVRKVRIAAAVLGLEERITLRGADTNDANDSLRSENPLGKIPTLLLENGTTLFDSRVIVDYLDELAGGGKILPRGPQRFAVLRLQALADGLCDAALLQVYEARYRPEDKRSESWVANQASKVGRALAALEASELTLGTPPNAGEIALACALGYLDLRFAGRWREHHPALVAWLDRFSAEVPVYAATAAA